MSKSNIMNLLGSLLVGLSLANSLWAFAGGLIGLGLVTAAPYFKE